MQLLMAKGEKKVGRKRGRRDSGGGKRFLHGGEGKKLSVLPSSAEGGGEKKKKDTRSLRQESGGAWGKKNRLELPSFRLNIKEKKKERKREGFLRTLPLKVSKEDPLVPGLREECRLLPQKEGRGVS